MSRPLGSCLNSPQADNDSILMSSKQHQRIDMSSAEGLGRLSTSPSPPPPKVRTHGQMLNGTKKRKITDPSALRSVPHHRKTACQSCRTRKVKCDNRRPCCAFRLSSGVECVNLDWWRSKLLLDTATTLMVQRLDEIPHGVEDFSTLLNRRSTTRAPPQLHPENNSMASHSHEEAFVIERSRDYLQIPACRATADTALTWPIWRDKYGTDSLISTVFHSTGQITGIRRVRAEISDTNHLA